MQVERFQTILRPNPKRVVLLPFNIKETEVKRIAYKLASYSDDEINQIYEAIKSEFENRHSGFEALLNKSFDRIKSYIPGGRKLSPKRIAVLSSYFYMEYAFEGAALFNPSIVPDLEQGSVGLNFILTLRATGEGHISSLTFLRGKFGDKSGISFDPASQTATIPHDVREVNADTTELKFEKQTELSERIIFPVTGEERNGIEDVRLVQFMESVERQYLGTYTAYDGHRIRSKILETNDFITFRLHRLHGAAIDNKGMALFPRKLDGRFTMISRQDDINLRIMTSDTLLEWESSDIIAVPERSWELTKIGNCGSPMETEAGWLVLTHGVGPMRKYSIGALLLDAKNPTKVIGRLKKPLLAPNDSERVGYVPNVVYSCGGIIHQEWLILPYAMSDSASGFARVKVRELIDQMD